MGGSRQPLETADSPIQQLSPCDQARVFLRQRFKAAAKGDGLLRALLLPVGDVRQGLGHMALGGVH